MAYLQSIDDSKWDEVKFINGYAIFMGYLMMGVRGLSVLIITWTTVVLLGGFVSVLGKKDFWCLTGITLVQTAGVFNFLSRDKLSDIVQLSWGLLGTVVATVSRLSIRKDKTSHDDNVSIPRLVVAFGLSALQLLVFAVILCPLAILFVFGLYISAAISLWRLIEHDFSNVDGGSNLKPALEVLYGLAVAQGILFGYRTMHYFGAKIGLVDFVAQRCSMDKSLVSDYLKYTVAGCEKDSSFATGRNLVTYGLDLMAAESNFFNNDSLFAGVRVLGTPTTDDDRKRQVLLGHLLTRSPASGHMIQRLLEILARRSYYELEVVELVANVLTNVAHNICLLRFTEVVPFISGLLDTLDFKELVTTKVARILSILAAEEDNWRIISSAEGVLSKTMRHLIFLVEQHNKNILSHDKWCSMVYEWLEFISRLTGAPGWTTLQEIQPTIQCILECTKCDVSLKRQAVNILLDLSTDMPSYITASPITREIFTWMLLHIGTISDPGTTTNRLFIDRRFARKMLAREKLKAMLGLESNMNTKESVRAAVDHLARIIITAEAGNSKYRLLAVQVLLDVCSAAGISDNQFAVPRPVLDVMPQYVYWLVTLGGATHFLVLHHPRRTEVLLMLQLLEDMLGCGSAPSTDDIEKGRGEQDASSSQRHNGEEQRERIQLQEAFISLCKAIYKHPYLRSGHLDYLNAIAASICLEQGIPIPVMDFDSLVSYAQDRLEEQKKRASYLK